jgi:hypothetical protein
MLYYLLIVAFFFNSCFSSRSGNKEVPSKVTLQQTDGKYAVFVNGEKFIVKGAGVSHRKGDYYKKLQEAGGNSFRTWDTKNAAAELDSAMKYNLMVAMGIQLNKELLGFDYNDTEAVKKQFEKVKQMVDKYKNHPNLLCWIVGNELNLLFDEKGQSKMINPKGYNAINEIAEYIHNTDPNHPVTTAFAGVNPNQLQVAAQHCTALDFFSYQVYGGLGNIEKEVQATGITKPYMITEFGPVGHWEMPSTKWGSEIEEPSGAKAAGMADRYRKGIEQNQSGLCLGGFVFQWGQKQERTPTWYGMFHKSGEATSSVDEFTKIWTGSYPSNRAPAVYGIKLNDVNATDNVTISAGGSCKVVIDFLEPDGDSVRYKWVVLNEVKEKSQGGHYEAEPDEVKVEVISSAAASFVFQAPQQPGAYRVFAYVYDGKGKAGNANFPFYVK